MILKSKAKFYLFTSINYSLSVMVWNIVFHIMERTEFQYV